MFKALSNVDIIYNKGISYIYKPEQFTLKIKEETYEEKFELVTYTITYNNRHKLTYDLNVKANLGDKPLFTYYNPSSSNYLVKEAYCYFSKKYRNRPILFGFRTNNDEYYYYTFYELKYARTSYTIAVKNIHKIARGDEKSRLYQEADIIEKENTLTKTYEKGYGCVFLGNKGTDTKEYVVNVGSNVLCSITPSKQQCNYCKNVDVVTYKIVYIGDPQYHLWENAWYQWSNSYYYIYIYSGTNYKNRGSLIYTYYPRNNDYTAIYVLVFYSVLYVNDPFYIVFSTKEEYNLVSSFDVIKSKGSGYSYDFLSVSEDHVPQNVREAYSKYPTLIFEIGTSINQHVKTYPPNDSESSRLTFGNKKYKKVIFTPDLLPYKVIGHILFSCRLFSINPSEDSCPYKSIKTKVTSSNKEKVTNKPINNDVLKDVNYQRFNGAIVYYTNQEVRVDKNFSRSQRRDNEHGSLDRFIVPENVALLVDFIKDCNSKTQFVRKDVDGNKWVKEQVEFKSDAELVTKLDEIVKALEKPESRKRLEEELSSIKTSTKPEPAAKKPPQPGPAPRPPPQPPTNKQVPPEAKDVRHPTSPTHPGQPTGTQRPSEKTTSTRDPSPKSKQRPTPSPGGPSLKETPSHIPSGTHSGRDPVRTPSHPSPPAAPPPPGGSAPKTSNEGRGQGVPGGRTTSQPGRPDSSQAGRQNQKGPKTRVQTPEEKRPQRTHVSTTIQRTHQQTTSPSTPSQKVHPQHPQKHHRVPSVEHPKQTEIPPQIIEPSLQKTIVILIDQKRSYNFLNLDLSYLLYKLDNHNILNKNDTIKVEDKNHEICYLLKKNGYTVYEHDFHHSIQSVSRDSDKIELKIYLEDYDGHRELRLFNNDKESHPFSLYYNQGQNNINVYFNKSNSKPLLFCYNNTAYHTISYDQYNQNWFKDTSIKNCTCLDSGYHDSYQLLEELNKVKDFLKKYESTLQMIYDSHLGEALDGEHSQYTQVPQDTSAENSGTSTTTIAAATGGSVTTAALVGAGATIATHPEWVIPVIKALV